MKEQTRWLDEKEVSKLTGIALSTLRNWRFRKVGIRYSKIYGRMIRYNESHVREFMQDHLVETNDHDYYLPVGRSNLEM